jgi:hypothetical protein
MMPPKKGIGSYPDDEDVSEGSGSPDENMGSNKQPSAESDDDPDRIRRDLDRYRDEMAVDAPDSGSPEDRD